MQSPEASPSLPVEFQRPETNPRMQSSKDDLGYIPLGQGNCQKGYLFLKPSFPLGEGVGEKPNQEGDILLVVYVLHS